MKIPVRLCIGLLVATLPLAAQTAPPEKQEEPKKTGRQVRFLPVGELPPFQQEIRDGVAYEKEPPPGSIPPRQVILGAGDDTRQTAPLLLGQVTSPFDVPAGEGPLIVRRPGEDEKAVPWLEVQRPAEGNFMVILWRDPVVKSWTATRALVLQEDLESAPPGTVQFVNISTHNVGVVFGGEKLALLAGKTFRRKVPIGKDTPFELGVADAGGVGKRFHSGTLFQNPGERSLSIVYLADGVAPRSLLKTIVLREPVELPAKATAKTAPR